MFECLHLERIDIQSNSLPTMEWTIVMRYAPEVGGFKGFVDYIMSVLYTLMHGETPPRIFGECMKLIQQAPNVKVGEWYIFKDHTIIRVYGAEVKPYKIPIYLTMHIHS